MLSFFLPYSQGAGPKLSSKLRTVSMGISDELLRTNRNI